MYIEQLNHVTDALLEQSRLSLPTTAWALTYTCTSLQRVYEQVIADIFLVLPCPVHMLSC